MAETDHGEVLTRFEEIFGSLVEHEVIKMVLQSCDWDSSSAWEMIIGMVDQDQLPAHIRDAVVADAVIRGGPSSIQEAWQSNNDEPVSGLEDMDEILNCEGESSSTGTPDGRSSNISRNDSPVCSTSKSRPMPVNGPHGSRPSSCSSVLTPFAMAQETIAKEPYLSSGAKQRPWSVELNPQENAAAKREEKEVVDALAVSHDDLSSKSSDSLSTHSPVRASAPDLDFEANRASDTSRWVLAPEFVPNAFNQTSFVRPTNCGGFWPFGMGYGFTAITQESAPPSNVESKVKAKLSKKDEIINKTIAGTKIVVLMRGLPGSGKSTLAKEIKGRSGVVLSTDDYFNDKHGRYNYDQQKLGTAHAWNLNRARLKLRDGRTPVIIDNTNIKIWEMKPYVKLALQHGYEVDILEPENSWKFNPKELAKRNNHGVPKSKIKEMKGRYDGRITIDHVIASLKDFKMDVDESADQDLTLIDPPPLSKTEWPTTLPEPAADEKNVKDGEEAAAYFEADVESRHDAVEDLHNSPNLNPVIKSELNTSNKVLPEMENIDINSGLSYLQMYGYEYSEDADDADVIIEGYDDSEESDCDAEAHNDRGHSGSKERLHDIKVNDIFDTKPCESQGIILSQNAGKRNIDVECSSLTELSEVNGNSAAFKETRENLEVKVTQVDNESIAEDTDAQNEEKIRALIEEANMDVDQYDTDWDDLAVDACDEEFNDDKFSELVSEFDSSLRRELNKKGKRNSGDISTSSVQGNADIEEDSAMYDLCSNIEDKIGQSLSSVLTGPKSVEEPSSLFSIINSDNFSGIGVSKDIELQSVKESPVDLVCDKNNDFQSNDHAIGTERDGVEMASSHTLMSHDVYHSDDNEIVVTVPSNERSDSLEHYIKSVLDGNCEKVMREDTSQTMEASLVGEESGCYLKNANHQNDSVKAKLCSDSELAETKKAESHSNDTKEISIINPCSSVTKPDKLSEPEICAEPCQNSISLASWECVDVNGGDSSLQWDSKNKESVKADRKTPKPTRDRRRRTSGDPQKWLLQENEDSAVEQPDACVWEPVKEGGVVSWDTTHEKKTQTKSSNSEPQPHTGAVPKMRKTEVDRKSLTVSDVSTENSRDRVSRRSSSFSPVLAKTSVVGLTEKSVDNNEKVDNQTQTLSIDFQALDLDNNLYELKIIYGQPGYVPEYSDDILPDNGPLTKGKLSLDKGTMTDSSSEVIVVKPLQNLVAFFPNIAEADLRDVLEKCRYDLDWTMNVLLDSGYEMADPVEACNSQEGSEVALEEGGSTTETNSSGDDVLDQYSIADCNDVIDIPADEKNRRLKQSQQPDDLVSKREIENSFTFSGSVDDRVTRLTGKDFDNLNMNKVKQRKTKKKSGKKKQSESTSNVSDEAINCEEGEGAQYVTLVMDPLFASQLVSMFGPIGSCGMSGEMAPEDRSVILPLELCHQIHKYWTKTLDGKFSHEAEVLDSLIREDENLARRLQEEEELASKNKGFNDNSSTLDNSEKAFQLDPPTNFKEIMDLEQALLESQGDSTPSNAASLSSHLSLQRLYTDFPRVDREALKQAYIESAHNYQDTFTRISNRYGGEQDTPKTVIAPELLQQYEQQMIQKAKELSLAQQELQEGPSQQDEDDLLPDDPQVYRDEAQTHYQQRQEYYRKAQEAHRQGLKAAAAYYASIGKKHSEKLNEANHRASVKILEAVNSKRDANALDLHLLHVPEALRATQAFLSEREQLLTARGINQMHVSLITGRGAHSFGGQARLKPAIKDFLKKKGYLFHEANSGMFVVTLKR